jgi:hypothetical protein
MSALQEASLQDEAERARLAALLERFYNSPDN